MRFEVLGHLRARTGSDPAEDLALGGPRQRLVLALLLAKPNEVVSTDRLIDGVWGDDVPNAARHTVQGYLSELRKVVGPVIERSGSGYCVRVDRTSLDALEFEAGVSEGVDQTARHPERAVSALREALLLWRDEPFGGVEPNDVILTEVARLAELRLVAFEHLVRAELALGRPHRVVGELERLTAEHPYREDLRASHMLALYRCGRQADALRAFQRTARVLEEELGIDPSPGLARLEQQILVQDPDLDLAVEPVAADVAAVTAPVQNPYKGLQPFREGDRGRFHGRSALIEEICDALGAGAPMVAVVGPSGSGKSSVISAGVVAQWRDRAAGRRAVVATMQPGAHPFADLEVALLRAVDDPPASLPQLSDGADGLLRAALHVLGGNSGQLLLVIDQFEELFTLVAAAERSRFLRAVATAASDTRTRVQVLIALRADFYDRPLVHRDFARLFTQHVFHVLPLGDDELEAAAVLPARQTGLTIEPRLLAALIADVRDQPNALPLFQYALTELYERRDGVVLTLAGYQAFGGLRRAVANRADELYASLDEEQQDAARQLFLRLVAVAGDAEGRRRILASELTALEVDVVALQAAIEAFASHRLLTLDRDPATGAPTVEVAHEALLQEWRLLREWLDVARADLRLHRGFAIAVQEWVEAGRDEEFLLSGGRLAEYERWAEATALRLTSTERAFLDEAVTRHRAVIAAEEDRRAAETTLRRGARRRTWALLAAVVALAGVLVAVIFAPGPRAAPAVGIFGFDGGVGNSLHDLVITGAERAAHDLDVEPVVVGTALSDPGRTLAELADGTGLVIVGGLVSDALTAEIVAAHPNTRWVVLEPPIEPPRGVSAVWFAVEQGAFLVGAAAAHESSSGVVGFVGGQQNPRVEAFRAGFEAGAQAIDPDVEVLSAFVATAAHVGFRSPDRARLVATSLYEQGADVLFQVAGESGYGVFEAADVQSDVLGRHLWAIGVDTDQFLELPAALREHALTSMVKRYDLAVHETVRAFLDSEPAPASRVFTVADGGVGYSTSGDHLRPQTLEELAALEADLVAGRRTVPHVPTGLVEAPLGATTAVPVRVTWDGRTCVYDGPASWRTGEVIRFDVANAAGAAVQMWAQHPGDQQPMVGIEVAPGTQGSATLEVADDQTLAVVCHPLVDGRPSAGGAVEAIRFDVRGRAGGPHTTTELGPTLTYSIPEGWIVDEFTGGIALSPPNWDEWPAIVVLTGVRAADQTCAERPEPGVEPSAAAIAAWLAAHPAMATIVAPVELGGLRGHVVDQTLRDEWDDRGCRMGANVAAVPTLIRSASTLEQQRADDDGAPLQWWVQEPGWTTRYYLLDAPGFGPLVVNVETPGDKSNWDELFAQVEPVLATFAFSTTAG